MLSTRIRTTAAGLIAASTFALAVTPGAAVAQKNIPGRFQKSSEAIHLTMYACYGDNVRYNQLVNATEEFLRAGGRQNEEAAAAAGSAANHVYEVAQAGGCLWAQ
jgi:hypothetical protein